MLIATDLDGTLVPDSSTSLSPYTAEVLKRVDDAGIPVVFVTGRPLRWMETFWPHIGEHGLAVVSNGAVTYDVHEREVVTTTGIEPALGLEIAAAISAEAPGSTFAIERLAGIRQDPNFIERYRVPEGSRRGPLAEIWDVPAVKLLVRHETLDHDAFRDRVTAAVGDLANATWSVPGLVEISAAGVTKASALVGLCATLGVEAPDVVAFGDMPNDIPMLEWAGTSYAVANAHDSVLAMADHVAPSCEEEGVARVMDGLLASVGRAGDRRPRSDWAIPSHRVAVGAGKGSNMSETTSVDKEAAGRGGSAPLTVQESTPQDTRVQVSTGNLPDLEAVLEIVTAAHRSYARVDDGVVADYIPALAQASPDLFGVAVAGVHGQVAGVGDSTHAFTIQSVAKPFQFALVCEALGHREVRERLGVNATGLPFDSVMAVELASHGLTNPMVNSGAIAATSLAPGRTAELKWRFLREGLSRFAGRELELDEEVLESERATNGRNEAMARLLGGHGRIYFDPDEATDVYTRQGCLLVTAEDLALMGATLADGGVNPVTERRVVSEDTCRRTLALMLTAGLYERSGEWLYEIGLPAKSGVSGGIVTIAPGKGGLATFSPPLDPAGNSVRGQLVTKLLSEALGLDILASSPVAEVR